MENKLIDRIADAFNVPSPEAENMDDYLDILLREIRQWSEDLPEQEFYVGKPWLLIKDDVEFHDAILLFFNEDGEYLQSTNGDVETGMWRYLENANKLLLDMNGESELYDLAFLDDHFFILDKHGDQKKLGNNKYMVMAYEPIANGIEWRDAMEYLFNKYRNNANSFIAVVLVVMLVIAIFVALSLA